MKTLRIVIIAIVVLSYIDNGYCQQITIPEFPRPTPEALLSMEMIGSGFRRILKYNVLFPFDQGMERAFRIHQHFPASVYVDMDELGELQRKGKVKCFFFTTLSMQLFR